MLFLDAMRLTLHIGILCYLSLYILRPATVAAVNCFYPCEQYEAYLVRYFVVPTIKTNYARGLNALLYYATVLCKICTCKQVNLRVKQPAASAISEGGHWMGVAPQCVQSCKNIHHDVQALASFRLIKH